MQQMRLQPAGGKAGSTGPKMAAKTAAGREHLKKIGWPIGAPNGSALAGPEHHMQRLGMVSKDKAAGMGAPAKPLMGLGGALEEPTSVGDGGY